MNRCRTSHNGPERHNWTYSSNDRCYYCGKTRAEVARKTRAKATEQKAETQARRNQK